MRDLTRDHLREAADGPRTDANRERLCQLRGGTGLGAKPQHRVVRSSRAVWRLTDTAAREHRPDALLQVHATVSAATVSAAAAGAEASRQDAAAEDGLEAE